LKRISIAEHVNHSFYRQTFWPNLDIFVSQTGDFIITAELSELRSENLDLTVERSKITIAGDRRDPDSEESGSVVQKEIPRGTFKRVVDVPADFDLQAAKAAYLNGVLRITVPAKAPGATSPQ